MRGLRWNWKEAEMTTTPKVEPASDEQLKIWQERPCGDTQCRCTELHLDQAIARIEADRARIRELEQALRVNESARNDYLRAELATAREKAEAWVRELEGLLASYEQADIEARKPRKRRGVDTKPVPQLSYF